MTLHAPFKRLVAALLLVSLLAPLACNNGGPAGESTLDRIKRTGVCKVGFADEAPYAYRDSETETLTGEAPEIARVILGKLGTEIKVEGVLVDWDGLIPGLKANRFDIIAAGMYITPERAQSVAFSNPTYSIGEAFMVVKGNPKNLHSYEDLRDNDEAKLGVVQGTVEIGYAEKVGVPDERVVKYPDHSAAVADLKAGRIDAYAGTALTIQDLLSKVGGDDVERADPFTDPAIDGESIRGYGAFAFRPADTALRSFFNVQIAAFIGSPEHRALVEPFGFTESELPGGKTAEELSAE